MKPNTRLLIRFTMPNGDMKGWGYDYPHYKTNQQLHDAIVADFKEWPVNTEVHLFYYQHDEAITVSDNVELADTAIEWLDSLETYNGN